MPVPSFDSASQALALQKRAERPATQEQFHIIGVLNKLYVLMVNFFFFKQKTAYEMTCDWSSDVCSSDLTAYGPAPTTASTEWNGRDRRRAGRGGLPQDWCERPQIGVKDVFPDARLIREHHDGRHDCEERVERIRICAAPGRVLEVAPGHFRRAGEVRLVVAHREVRSEATDPG